MKTWFIILAFIFGNWGCSSGAKIGGLLHPLSDIQKAIVASFPEGLEQADSKKRVFYSKFFDPNALDFGDEIIYDDEEGESKKRMYREVKVDAEELSLFRGQVVATVRGSSRPYTLKIKVFVDERKDVYVSEDPNKLYSGEWEKQGQDDELTEYFAEKIKSILAKHHRTKNIIDDFRSF